MKGLQSGWSTWFRGSSTLRCKSPKLIGEHTDTGCEDPDGVRKKQSLTNVTKFSSFQDNTLRHFSCSATCTCPKPASDNEDLKQVALIDSNPMCALHCARWSAMIMIRSNKQYSLDGGGDHPRRSLCTSGVLCALLCGKYMLQRR